MLKFNADWRSDSPSPIPQYVIEQFFGLISRCAVREHQQDILEHFKGYFATAAGTTSSGSSSASWAETDLRSYMSEAGSNAPLFIEAFYDAFQALGPDFARPSVERINRVLQDAKSGWAIQPPHLVRLDSVSEPIRAQEEPISFDKQARELIQNSLSTSEKFLAERKNRQAVTEILWLLETVSTAFQGMNTGSGTVEGTYFNKIAGDLRKHQRGKTLDRVLEWVLTLHGYLSSPTGGGIRHGMDLNSDMEEMGANEARLFCNLISSYIHFLVAEHNRLSKQK
jgi:hypothetical protein